MNKKDAVSISTVIMGGIILIMIVVYLFIVFWVRMLQ